ncbi:MAG: PAS domain S-box protein [Gammaproteobacteria bacterium]
MHKFEDQEANWSTGEPPDPQRLTENLAALQHARDLSDERYLKVLRAIPDAIIVSRVSDGLILETNAAVEKVLGFNPSELVGRTSLDAGIWFSEEQRNQLRELVKTTGFIHDLEVPFRRRDGTRRLGLVHCELATIADELVSIGVIRDITAIREVEQALRDSEQRFAQIFRCIPDAIVITHMADSAILDVNEAFEQVTGWSRTEVIGKRATDILYANPRDREVGLDLLKRFGNIRNFESTTRKKSGEVFFNNTSVQLFNIKGEPCVVAVVRDITEKKRSDAALLAEKERAQRYLDIAGSFIVALDANGCVQLLNRRGREMLGYSEGTLKGMNWFETVVSPLQRVSAKNDFLALMAGSTDQLLDQDLEIVTHRGELRQIVWNVALMRDDQGKVTGSLCSGIDVTTQKRIANELAHYRDHLEDLVRARTEELARANEELRIAKEQAESADRLKSTFLATMSHELRTPLNSILGFSGIMHQGLAGPLNDEQKKHLATVISSGKHLLALISDILDISKIESGQLEYNFDAFPFSATVEKTVQMVRPDLESKGLQLKVSVAREVGEIVSDQRRVEQVLLNLLNNSVKFTEEGEINLTCDVEGQWLRVRVRDTGIGIKPEDVAELFQPFRQVDGSLARRYEGSGLGLAICKHLVNGLGGDISVSSEFGVGSTFTVTLPLAAKA